MAEITMSDDSEATAVVSVPPPARRGWLKNPLAEITPSTTMSELKQLSYGRVMVLYEQLNGISPPHNIKRELMERRCRERLSRLNEPANAIYTKDQFEDFGKQTFTFKEPAAVCRDVAGVVPLSMCGKSLLIDCPNKQVPLLFKLPQEMKDVVKGLVLALMPASPGS